MIDLYYWPTPNGKKVTILLEEVRHSLQRRAPATSAGAISSRTIS